MTNVGSVNEIHAQNQFRSPNNSPKRILDNNEGEDFCLKNITSSVFKQRNSVHTISNAPNPENTESDSDTLSNLSNASFSSNPPEDSFFLAFPGQTSNSIEIQSDLNTQTEKNISNLHASFYENLGPEISNNFRNDNSLNLNESFDRFSMSETIKNNEKLTDIISNLNQKLKNRNAENLELKKKLANQNCITSLETTINLQRDQINNYEHEKIVTELEMEEATTVFEDFETLLENTNRKLNLTESLYNESIKKIDIAPTELSELNPIEVYEMYKKINNLYKKQTENVRDLLGELESNKKNYNWTKK